METRRGLGLEAARGPRLNLETPRRTLIFPKKMIFLFFNWWENERRFCFCCLKRKAFLILLDLTACLDCVALTA
jgi:hypothetical protein